MVEKTSGNAGVFRETAAKILAGLALFIWLCFFGLFEHYSYTRPTTRNPIDGRVYQQNNHGYYTYLTEQEHSRLTILEITAPVLFLMGLLIHPALKGGHWRRNSLLKSPTRR